MGESISQYFFSFSLAYLAYLAVKSSTHQNWCDSLLLVVHVINFEGEGLNRQDAKYAKKEGKKRNLLIESPIIIDVAYY